MCRFPLCFPGEKRKTPRPSHVQLNVTFLADKKTQSLTGCESVMCEVSVKVQQNRSILTVRILEKIGISERKPQAEAGMCELMNAANYV